MASPPGPRAGWAINVAWYAAERVRSCVTGAFELCGWCCLCTFTSRRASLPLLARLRAVIRTEITQQSHGSFTPAKHDRHRQPDSQATEAM